MLLKDGAAFVWGFFWASTDVWFTGVPFVVMAQDIGVTTRLQGEINTLPTPGFRNQHWFYSTHRGTSGHPESLLLIDNCDTDRLPYAGLMLGQRLRRWPSIKPALGMWLITGGAMKQSGLSLTRNKGGHVEQVFLSWFHRNKGTFWFIFFVAGLRLCVYWFHRLLATLTSACLVSTHPKVKENCPNS